ncbi:hypothetical protein A6M27_01330 [Acidithiobacillus thiooxidans]|uniref:Uncharacterized protein n=1 Tax=Acidithiobacillus thiooxidans TaxID=930 RepID=A0A1C2JMS2_ACITH|nr:hypothetical protein A6O24_08505 [Acidithiobacillus thiooxidans]OCX76726.1 hypothetical protein A6P07_02025 [Acidithiobacillus thiooxidans]OCX81190.1 hypothetical protein A6O26_13595 [Acidithiobacillus thiooxidans]OCX89537.1 hypothetical protein A6M27_01330 [Acidithiobacillus thiooxidans]
MDASAGFLLLQFIQVVKTPVLFPAMHHVLTTMLCAEVIEFGPTLVVERGISDKVHIQPTVIVKMVNVEMHRAKMKQPFTDAVR